MHGAKHTLHDLVGRETLSALPRHRVHHIPHIARHGQLVVQVAQRLRGAPLLADLEELDPDLPRGRVELVEFPRGGDDGRFHVISRHAVGDDDDVHRLAVFRAFLLALPEVGAQEAVEAASGRGAAARADGVKDALDVVLGGNVFVFGGVGLVQEIDVDAVGVEARADGGDGGEGVGDFAPGAAGHAAGVVYEELGVESGEEGEFAVRVGGHVTGDNGFVSGRGISGGQLCRSRRRRSWLWTAGGGWCSTERVVL